MVDITIDKYDSKKRKKFPILFKDNGDGTYTEYFVVNSFSGEVEVSGGEIVVSGNVGGHISFPLIVEFTRESNATPYSIGDVLSSSASEPVLLEIPEAIQKNNGTAYVVGCQISFNVKSVTPRIRVHMFNASDPTIAGDNLPYKELYSDLSKCLGYFDMDYMVTVKDTANSDVSRSIRMDLRVPIKTEVSTRSIWILLELLDAVTLTSGSKVSIQMIFDDN